MTQSPGEAETCRKKYANTVHCPPGARSTNEKWVVDQGDEHYNTVGWVSLGARPGRVPLVPD
mgnify:CR=1